MAVVQLSEVTHPLWTCSVEHQVGVHAANLESVGDRAVTADVFINTRQFALGRPVSIQVHREHSPSGRSAKTRRGECRGKTPPNPPDCLQGGGTRNLGR